MSATPPALDFEPTPREWIAQLTRVLADEGHPPDTSLPPDYDGEAPIAVGILPPADRRIGLAVQPITGDDPVVPMLGFVAPDEWLAFGVRVFGNWFSHQSDDTRYFQRIPRRRPHGRARLAHLVDREGRAYLAVVRPGHEPHHDEVEPGTAWLGRVDDAIRRVLALPTAPPQRDVQDLWAAVWLDVLCERALLGERLSWEEVVAAHPAYALPDRGTGGGEPPPSAHAFAATCQAFAATRSWAEVRAACAAGSLSVGSVGPELAGWMDEGIFSRTVLAAYPETAELARDLAPVLGPEIHARVRKALRRWDLLS